MKIRLKYKIVGFIIFILFIIIAKSFSDSYKRKKYETIMSEFDFAKGKVVKIHNIKYGEKMEYFFIISGKKYQFEVGSNILLENREYIYNSFWPVIYSKKIPEYNQILIDESDFEKYGLKKPDSLNKNK